MDKIIGNVSRFAQMVTSHQQINKDQPKEEVALKANLSDQVNISDEAKTKLSEESQKSVNEALQNITGKGKQKTDDSMTEMEKLDEKIAELQEKLKELQQEMSTLRLKGDEASLAKLKLLELEMVSINEQLLELNNQKIEMMKSG
ncbi:hypothetical protein [Pseudoalteromonas denitrificans]|uniref:Uncharacterized protein n=1 Tax=Pseudoalteromonas denitrificans DSM 6059 TaxID=1123010 RepID=A0A1I1P490_9GAMM|nr:hypothetical protein [Pseudoalteromonas denitrificans]SFD04649.1 hypothetical protein SAMN02745724_03300 [Pseudoalteromonas denitrificans DSM 6059]